MREEDQSTVGDEILDGEENSFEFESVSCFVFSKYSKPRQWTIQLLRWPYPFENKNKNNKARIPMLLREHRK